MSQAQIADYSVQAESKAGRSLWADAWRRLARDPSAMICLAVIALYAVIAIGSAVFFHDFMDRFDYDQIHQGPSWEHWLGTDEFGRDVLQKTMVAAKVSMTVGVASMILAIPVGMLLGAIAGYFGGFIDDLIVWLYSTLAAIPGLVRVIAVKFAFQDAVLFRGEWYQLDFGGLPGVILALSITGWIGTCRLVRAETLKIRELDYVLAARGVGRGSFPILLRHVIPNLLHLGIINFSLGFIGAIKAEVTLSYLGIGVTKQPSWGQMISSSQMDVIVGRYWQLAAAAVAMFFLVLALNIFGDRLRDALDPRLRSL
jgi:peptide/nickel transport system permease protein